MLLSSPTEMIISVFIDRSDSFADINVEFVSERAPFISSLPIVITADLNR